MTLTALYPDPFDDVGNDDVCALSCDLTIGPCFANSPRRMDISEGALGVPLRLVLRVVESDGCTPVPDADVDVWHCGPDGLYTGDDALPACTRDDVDARSRQNFAERCRRTTKDVSRSTRAFPAGTRAALCIHIRVRSSTRGAVATQLFFPEDVTAEISATVAGYLERGPPDTGHSDDLLAAENDPARFIARVQRMPDGAMLASKTLVCSGAWAQPTTLPAVDQRRAPADAGVQLTDRRIHG